MIEPYWSDDSITLYCGDFRELLPGVLERHGEPDLALTDPPYGETSLAWDRWPEGWPSLIPGRSMWCWGSMRMFLDKRDEFSGWHMSQDIVWTKNRGNGMRNDRFLRGHDNAVHWYRGPWEQVHREVPRHGHIGPDKSGRRSEFAADTYGAMGAGAYKDDGKRMATSVLYAPNVRFGINETEKPAGLVETLLAYGCPPGGLVLDVFAGSCSTLLAARNNGRRAIGIELRQEQCELAVERRLSQSVLPFGEAS